MKRQFGLLAIGFGFTLNAFAAIPAATVTDTPVVAIESPSEAEKCVELKEEIKDLRAAQSTLMKSLVQKNDTLAETLDIFAKDVLGQKTSNKKTNSKKLKQAASSFRSHSIREQGLVDRFEALAQDLYARIDNCLVTKTVSAAKSSAEPNLSPVTSSQQ